MSFITIKGQKAPEKPRVSHFSWQLAGITDRHNEMRDSEITSTDILHKIHRKYDPDHEKALARLRREYSKI